MIYLIDLETLMVGSSIIRRYFGLAALALGSGDAAGSLVLAAVHDRAVALTDFQDRCGKSCLFVSVSTEV